MLPKTFPLTVGAHFHLLLFTCVGFCLVLLRIGEVCFLFVAPVCFSLFYCLTLSFCLTLFAHCFCCHLRPLDIALVDFLIFLFFCYSSVFFCSRVGYGWGMGVLVCFVRLLLLLFVS